MLQLPTPERALSPTQLASINVTLTRIPDATPTDTQRVLGFLNAAQTPEQIAETVEFAGERDVGIRVAQRILARRQELGAFNSLNQLAEIPQVGPERFAEIVTALSEPAPATGEVALRGALEDVQATFGAWNREPGAASAQDVVARTTYLLSIVESWGDEEFARAVRALAWAMVTFREALVGEAPSESLERFQASADRLLELSQQLVEAGLATSASMSNLSSALQQLTQRYRTILQGPS
jgi:hypothetical protein